MPIIPITNFGNGWANDYVKGGRGECSVCKHFDILTYPYRLQPLRGMTNSGEPTDTLLGNMILGANGIFYGIGANPSLTTQGRLYKRTGIGGSDVWQSFSTVQNASNTSAVTYDFLVHYPEMGATRKLFWADPGNILSSDPADGGSSINSVALTYTTIGQGLVHPKDRVLYFPYQNSTQTIIGKISYHASNEFTNYTANAIELPNRYRVYNLSWYGDYLAIPMTTSGGSSNRSVLGLWDRDSSLTTLNETVSWGEGNLKVLNNLNGVLIGISEFGGGNPTTQDIDKIQIKAYAGGAEPVILKEIVATRLTTTPPTCSINPRVNFVHDNRLYFSVNVSNGGTAPSYYGVWSIGKNMNGVWTLNLERMATNDNSETGVIACAKSGDFFTMVHTTAGTLTYTVNGNTLSNIYNATSVYESTINPEMPEEDRQNKKKLKSVMATYLPLPVDAVVTMQYRVDSSSNGSWTTIFTESTDGKVRTEVKYNASKVQFTDGTNYEFRLTSTEGAIITSYSYEYEVIPDFI